MNESYAEYSVKRKKTVKDSMIKALMLFVTIFVLVIGLTNSLVFTIGVGLGVICYFMFPRMNVEYEYIYCDGQLDFDKIFGGAKRKNALRIDFDKVEMVAPVNSHTLDPYNNNPQLKIKDFTSLMPNKNIYAIIFKSEGIIKILFEPNEKIIECIKQKTPRKIATY